MSLSDDDLRFCFDYDYVLYNDKTKKITNIK